MFGEIAKRVLIELGPWLWMISGFVMMAAELFSGRGVGLSLGLGAMIAGTVAIFGASGIWTETSNLVQSLIFAGATITIFFALKLRIKRA